MEGGPQAVPMVDLGESRMEMQVEMARLRAENKELRSVAKQSQDTVTALRAALLDKEPERVVPTPAELAESEVERT